MNLTTAFSFRLIISAAFLAVLLSSCKMKKPLPSEHILSAAQVEADLKLFKNIIEAAHPSFDLYSNPEKFGLLADSLFPGAESITVREFHNRLSFMLNRLGCAHTGIYMSTAAYDSLQSKDYFFPYPVSWLDEKLLVNVKGYLIPEGAEIKTINGRPVAEIMAALATFECVEGKDRPIQQELSAANFGLEYFYQYGDEKAFSVVYVDTSGVRKQDLVSPVNLTELQRMEREELYYYDRTEIPYDLSFYEDAGLAVMKVSSFAFNDGQQQDGFDHFCINSFELLRAKPWINTLVIDLRQNKGGTLDEACLLFSYLAKEPFKEVKESYTRFRQIPFSEYLSEEWTPAKIAAKDESLAENFVIKGAKGRFLKPDSLLGSWEPEANVFKGKVLVITNSTTASSASYFATMVQHSGRGKIIGQETMGGNYSGNAGESLTYVLPNSSLYFYFPTGHILYYYRPEKNAGQAVVPDYLVPDNEASFRANQDRQLRFVSDSIFK